MIRWVSFVSNDSKISINPEAVTLVWETSDSKIVQIWLYDKADEVEVTDDYATVMMKLAAALGEESPWISFIQTDDRPLLLRADTICAIRPGIDGDTHIWVRDSSSEAFSIKEEYATVIMKVTAGIAQEQKKTRAARRK